MHRPEDALIELSNLWGPFLQLRNVISTMADNATSLLEFIEKICVCLS